MSGGDEKRYGFLMMLLMKSGATTEAMKLSRRCIMKLGFKFLDLESGLGGGRGLLLMRWGAGSGIDVGVGVGAGVF